MGWRCAAVLSPAVEGHDHGHHATEVVDRGDAVALLKAQALTRIAELVPIRDGRMLSSPFAFFRGAAAVMAHDLSTTPDAGLWVQLHGDAQLRNFGDFASPERALIFDLNDEGPRCPHLASA